MSRLPRACGRHWTEIGTSVVRTQIHDSQFTGRAASGETGHVQITRKVLMCSAIALIHAVETGAGATLTNIWCLRRARSLTSRFLFVALSQDSVV